MKTENAMQLEERDDVLDADLALARSVLYSTLAVALRPPVPATLGRLRDPIASLVLRDAAGVVDRRGLDAAHAETALRRAGGAEEEGAAAPTPVLPWVEELLAGAAVLPFAELGRAHGRLFGHTARGQVPPYETEYGQGEVFRQAEELADLGGFYAAFGLELPASRHERADHASVECEFLSFLGVKEGCALAGNDPHTAAAVRHAARLFLKEHLGQFGRAFALALGRAADHPFYRAAASLLFALLTSDCRLLDVPPGSQYLKLRPAAEPDVPMACGASGCSLLSGAPPACGE
jgi:TorA maturation chaperone TorD